MMTNFKVSCNELCGRLKPCGNVYCSNNPRFKPIPPKNKKRAEKRMREALRPKKTFHMGGGMRQSAY